LIQQAKSTNHQDRKPSFCLNEQPVHYKADPNQLRSSERSNSEPDMSHLGKFDKRSLHRDRTLDSIKSSVASKARQDKGDSRSLHEQCLKSQASLKSVSSSLKEKMISKQNEIAALKKQITERSNSLSPVKPSESTMPNTIKQRSLIKNEKSQVNPSSIAVKIDTARSRNSIEISNIDSRSNSISSSTSSVVVEGTKNVSRLQIASKPASSIGLKVSSFPCANKTALLSTQNQKSLFTNHFHISTAGGQVRKAVSYRTPSKYIKKTKYSIVKEQPVLSISASATASRDKAMLVGNSSDKVQLQPKTPSKFVSFSKYSLKRIRRSLSDENKGDKSSFTSFQSPSQQFARTVRTKYKMQKINMGIVKHGNSYDGIGAWERNHCWSSLSGAGRRSMSYRQSYVKPFWQRHRSCDRVIKPSYRNKQRGKKITIVFLCN